MDLTNPEDYEYEQKREERRCLLNAMIDAGAEAQKVYEEAQAAVRRAQKAEEVRRKKAKARIEELEKAARSAHIGLELSNDAMRELIAEYVPRELVVTRDKAHARMQKAARAHHKVKMELERLYAYAETKNPKKIEGVLTDARGNYIREDPDPSNPSALPPKKIGMVRNPNHWTSRQEKKVFMAQLEPVEVEAAEKQAAAEREERTYREAEDALSAAIEKARSNG